MGKSSLTGTSLVGTSLTRERAEHDYYATPFATTEAILQKFTLNGSILEPAAGEGHISKVLHDWYPNSEIVSTDLVQRDDPFGCGIIGGVDFLNHEYSRQFDNIITNPPFSLAQEFIEHSLEVATEKVLMFAKIQLLEGERRRKLFDQTPPTYVCVFTHRQSPMRNGSPLDENGKPWANTMCFAWFVWDKTVATTAPTIIWL